MRTELKTLPAVVALVERAPQLQLMLRTVGAVVDVDQVTAALVESGMRVQSLIDRVAEDLMIGLDLEIDSPDMLTEAEQIAGRLATVAADTGEIERERKLLTAPLNAVVKFINAGYGAPREHIQATIASLKVKILAYHQEQRRIANIAAEKERAKREADVLAAARAEAEANEQARALIAGAQEAQATGANIVAAELVQQASAVIDAARQGAHAAVQAAHTRVVSAPTAAAKGVRGTWKATVTDNDKVVIAVGKMLEAGDRSLASLAPVDMRAADALAKIQQAGMNIPGLRAEFVPSISVRKIGVGT